MKKVMEKVNAFMCKHSIIVLLLPFIICFTLFIVIPVGLAICLSFTNFNTIQFPSFRGLSNYIEIFTTDKVFMQNVLPNTIVFSLIVGPGGYVLSFLLAWVLAQITKLPRTILAVVIYSPSITSGVIMSTIWGVLFSGDKQGYINAFLIEWGFIDEPIQFVTSSTYLMPIMIIVALWSSMGVGFLSMLSGILNVNVELYEAAHLDGVKNRFQEMIYVTIPTMKPQMLFSAVMAIVNTFSSAGVGVALSGSNPTPEYAGQLLVNHIDDFGFSRYEMGYASALSVILLLIILLFSRVAYKLFGEKE